MCSAELGMYWAGIALCVCVCVSYLCHIFIKSGRKHLRYLLKYCEIVSTIYTSTYAYISDGNIDPYTLLYMFESYSYY